MISNLTEVEMNTEWCECVFIILWSDLRSRERLPQILDTGSALLILMRHLPGIIHPEGISRTGIRKYEIMDPVIIKKSAYHTAWA